MQNLCLVNQALSIVMQNMLPDEIKKNNEIIRKLRIENTKYLKEINKLHSRDDGLHYCMVCNHIGDRFEAMAVCDICNHFYHAECSPILSFCEMCIGPDCEHKRHCNECGNMEFCISCPEHINIRCARILKGLNCANCNFNIIGVCLGCTPNV